jgi:heat shock protein HslJ
MKRIHRYARPGFLAVLLLPIFASACIVVVEEDRERHRHLYGSEWYLEVVFYRTETIQDSDRTVRVSFAENGVLSGDAGCGPINGFYTVNENGGIDVDSVEMSSRCGGEQAAQLFADGLRSARTYEADKNLLRIATDNSGYLSFTADQ